MVRNDYCTLNPDFPERGYMMFLFVQSDGKVVGIYPMTPVFKSIEDATQAVQDMVSKGSSEDIAIPEIGIIVPVIFHSRYELYKGYWDQSTINFDITDRLRAFAPLIDKPQLYKLLVYPSLYDDDSKTWLFDGVIPFYVTAPDSQIEHFMITSNHVVEARAKYAAVYLFETPTTINWKTGEMVENQYKTESSAMKIN